MQQTLSQLLHPMQTSTIFHHQDVYGATADAHGDGHSPPETATAANKPPAEAWIGDVQGEVDALVCYVDELSTKRALQQWELERNALFTKLDVVSAVDVMVVV